MSDAEQTPLTTEEAVAHEAAAEAAETGAEDVKPLEPEGEPPAEAGLGPQAADPAAEAQAKADEYLALAQRTQADFENFRKRAARDAAAAADRGIEKLARELLPALDHLELALQAAESHDAGDWTKGIRGIQDELLGALSRVGIQPFSPQGEPFDPNEHEAMAQQPSDEVEEGNVMQVYQQGYRINGQILRPARVVVAGGGSV
jgi:molecular chaperone GrpE